MIPIVFGLRFFGRCDAIAGVGHVSTEFVHFCYAPIVPLRTVFVLKGGKSRVAAEIDLPFCWKSVLIAWARAILIALFAVAGCFLTLELEDRHPEPAIPIVSCGLCLALLATSYLSHGLGRANKETASEIRKHLDLSGIAWGEPETDSNAASRPLNPDVGRHDGRPQTSEPSFRQLGSTRDNALELLVKASILLTILGLSAVLYATVAFASDWSVRKASKPFLPTIDADERIPESPVELPKDASVRVLPIGEFPVELLVEETSSMMGYWHGKQPKLRFNGKTVGGRPVDHSPMSDWADNLGPADTVLRKADLKASFDLTISESMKHRAVPFTVEMDVFLPRRLDRDTFGPVEQRARTTGQFFAVTAEEYELIKQRDEALKKRRDSVAVLESYNADVAAWNHAVDVAVDRNTRLYETRTTWLVAGTVLVVIGLLLAIVTRHTMSIATAVLLLCVVLWFDYRHGSSEPQSLEQLQPIDIPARLSPGP